jgi:hypothetical protein
MAHWTKDLVEVTLISFSIHEVADPAAGVVASEDVPAIGLHDGQGWPLLVACAVEGHSGRLMDSLVRVEELYLAGPSVVQHGHHL